MDRAGSGSTRDSARRTVLANVSDTNPSVLGNGHELRDEAGGSHGDRSSELSKEAIHVRSLLDEDGDGFAKVGANRYSLQVDVQMIQTMEEGEESQLWVKPSVKRGCLDTCRTVMQRLHCTTLFKIKLLHWEYGFLCEENHIGPRAAQVICWRRTMLRSSAFFYAMALLKEGYDICVNLSAQHSAYENGTVNGLRLAEYAPYFRNLLGLEASYLVLCFVARMACFFLSLTAARNWTNFLLSAKYSGAAYFAAYAAPFLVLYVLPFRNAVDIKGIQQHICRDLLSGVNVSSQGWAPAKIFENNPMATVLSQVTTAGGLLQMLNSVRLNASFDGDAFCLKSPKAWGKELSDLVRSAGLIRPAPGKPCPAAEAYLRKQAGSDLIAAAGLEMANASLFQVAAIASASSAGSAASSASSDANDLVVRAGSICARASCAVCRSGRCLQLLPVMGATKALVGIGQVQQGLAMAAATTRAAQVDSTVVDTALALASVDPNRECSSCLQPLGDDITSTLPTSLLPAVHNFSCASLCLPYWAAQDQAARLSGDIAGQAKMAESAIQQAFSAFTQISTSAISSQTANEVALAQQLCADEAMLANLEAFSALATNADIWKILVGIRSGGKSLGALFPNTVAMMFGIFKGGCIARSVIPYSRVPGLLISSAIIFTLPWLSCLVVFIQTVIYTWATGIGLACFTAALLIFFPFEHALPCLHLASGWQMLEPSSTMYVDLTIARRQYMQAVFALFALVCFCLALAIGPSFDMLLEFGVFDVSLRDLRNGLIRVDLWTTIASSSFLTFCNLYGFAKISQICFADGCIYCILLVDEADVDPADSEFRAEHREHEVKLMKEFHAAFDIQGRISAPSLISLHKFFKARSSTENQSIDRE